MDQKIKTYISKVVLNSCTYHGENLAPSLINFFLGKNGSGKSTIAREIRDKKDQLTWEPGCDPNTMLMIYNEDYIKENIQSYGNIPGVFTMSKANAELKKKADEKAKEKSDVTANLQKEENTAAALINRDLALDEKYAEPVWKRTERWRKDYFPETQTGYTRDKKKFFLELITRERISAEIKALLNSYHTAFQKEVPQYQHYVKISDQVLPYSDIVRRAIFSRSDTDFAKFVRAIGNLDWIRAGYERYVHATDGRCPFCQQKIPSGFEEDLESCFDDQYRRDVELLKEFVLDYKDALNGIYKMLKANQNNPFPLDEYKAKEYQYEFDMFMEHARANVALLDDKVQNPSKELFEFEDLSGYLSKINYIIDSTNQDIDEYMRKATDPKEKAAVSNRIWSFMAYDCSDIFAKYNAEKDEIKAAQEKNGIQIDALRTQIRVLTTEINELNKSTVNTTKTMEDINATFRAIGFKGFYLREKRGASYVYELVREQNGEITIAKGLSEGERNFIAFLYFYHTVMGSQSDDGRVDDKIVVIDDPVSSMDENTFFYVSALVREMIAVCYNNYDMDENRGTDDHIRQFFCLTHNPVFFRDISNGRLPEYECVNFYEITKDKNNHSHVHLLEDDKDAPGGGKVNISPVKNYYDSLWYEFRRTESPEMALSLARQILEFFFIQTEGYKPSSLCDELFEGHKMHEFHRAAESGEIDSTYLTIAKAMVALLDVGVTNFNDRLFFNVMAYSPAQMREAFAIIFDVMDRRQHYNRMMDI